MRETLAWVCCTSSKLDAEIHKLSVLVRLLIKTPPRHPIKKNLFCSMVKMKTDKSRLKRGLVKIAHSLSIIILF